MPAVYKHLFTQRAVHDRGAGSDQPVQGPGPVRQEALRQAAQQEAPVAPAAQHQQVAHLSGDSWGSLLLRYDEIPDVPLAVQDLTQAGLLHTAKDLGDLQVTAGRSS